MQDESAFQSDAPDRRRVIRRSASEDVQGEARVADRRVRKPGLAGLLGDMLRFGGGRIDNGKP